MAVEALPSTLLLEIVTPDHSLVTDKVDEVVAPAADGYLGILPGHTPLLATLKVGELWYRIGQEKHYLAIAGGFVEVLPDRVTVLAQPHGGIITALRRALDAATGEIIARIRLGQPVLVGCSHESAKWHAPIETIEQIAQRARENAFHLPDQVSAGD